MNTVSFRLVGLTETIAALRASPVEMRRTAGAMIGRRADQAVGHMRPTYAKRTGRLERGLVVKAVTSGDTAHGVAVVIKNTAPHAYLYETGTRVRTTHRGQVRGRMPAFHVFIPELQAQRKGMLEDLRDILRDEGYRVSGE